MAAVTGLARITFEYVSMQVYPSYYTPAGKPHTTADQVPEAHWMPVERLGEPLGIRSQYEGLRRLMAAGELIRNPRMFTGEVDWQQVAP